VAPQRTLFVVKTTIEMEFTELFRIPSSNIYLLSGQVAQQRATPPVLLEKWVMSKVICERISTCNPYKSCRRISLSVCRLWLRLDTWTCQRSFKNVISNQDKFKCKFPSARSITELWPAPALHLIVSGGWTATPYYTFMGGRLANLGNTSNPPKVQCLQSLASDCVLLFEYYIFNCFTILA